MLCLVENVNPIVVFETKSGDLAVTRHEESYIMDFPLNPPTQEVQSSIRADHKHIMTHDKDTVTGPGNPDRQ